MESPNASPLPPGRPPLLWLPAELRFAIYDYLGSWEHKSYPFGRLVVTSIDRTAPPTALMATCRYLHHDILNHFYNTVTFYTAPQMIPGNWSAYADPITLLGIQRVKKMALRLSWDVRHKPRSGPGSCPNAACLDDMVVFLQREAKNLQTVTVLLTDLLSVDWDFTERMMAPLNDLAPQVVLCLGAVIASDDEKETRLRERLRLYLQALNQGSK